MSIEMRDLTKNKMYLDVYCLDKAGIVFMKLKQSDSARLEKLHQSAEREAVAKLCSRNELVRIIVRLFQAAQSGFAI